MMPSEYSQHCGYNEIDIMEMVDGGGTAYGTYWYWGPGGGGAPTKKPCNGAPVRAGTASLGWISRLFNPHLLVLLHGTVSIPRNVLP